MQKEPLMKYYFPTEKVSKEAARERAVISPPPFYLHLWWARRPLIGSRATIASLIVDVEGPPDKKFIVEFNRAIRLEPKPPRPAYNLDPDRAWFAKHSRAGEAVLLDVFAGGGSIPFEALRLGVSRVVAVEYNPVAYVILKATLEYPLKYRARLVKDVERWSRWLVERVKEELAELFPPHPQGRPANYVWIRVYRCPDGRLVPSISNPILSKDQRIVLKLAGFNDGNPVLKIEVFKGSLEEAKKKYRTIERNRLKCTAGILDSEELRRQYCEAMRSWEEEGRYGYHPAVLAAAKLESGIFVKPTDRMLEAYRRAEDTLRSKWDELVADDLIPTEEIPQGEKTREVLLRCIDRFYKLFNARQLLVHATIVKYIREAYENIAKETGDSEYAKAVVTYLALGHGRLLDYNSVITTWDSHGRGSINHTFSRHAYMFGDDFAEGDVLSDVSSISWVFFSNTGIVKALARIVELLKGADGRVEVVLGDAADPSIYEVIGSVDFVVTDPPYYDNVQYGELSDFFYVWWKRSIGELYPEAFSTELVPKEGEIVVNRVQRKDRRWFEERIKLVFELVRDNLAEDGRVAVMYAHRSSEGLIAMLRALLEAGYAPFAVWSFASEQPRSLHIVGKAAVRSLLVIGVEPRPEDSRGCFWDAKLQKMINEEAARAVRQTLDYGLSYIDALMTAVGRAFNVVGKCWPLSTLDGRRIGFEEVVDFVYRAAVRALASTILEAEVDPQSLMYLLARVVYGEPEFDDLRRLGYALGVDHNAFLGLYTEGRRTRRGAVVFPLKPLTRIEAPGTLIGALAEAAREYLRRGANAVPEVLKKHGYSLCDKAVVAYLQALLADIEASNGKGEEAKALRGIYELVSTTCDIGKQGKGKQTTLLDYNVKPKSRRG